MKHHDIFPYIEIMSPSVKDQSVGVQQQVEAKPETGNKLQHTLLHDTIQVQRNWHANICILALCVGELCHCIFYHTLAQLTMHGTTAKWPICISERWYIFNCAARNCGEQTQLARAAPARAWHLL